MKIENVLCKIHTSEQDLHTKKYSYFIQYIGTTVHKCVSHGFTFSYL